MHTSDAKNSGLVDGQILWMKNARGECLAELRLTDDIKLGVIQMATGAWFDPVGRRCISGNPNVLTINKPTSRLAQGPIAHSCLAEVSPAQL